MIDAAIVRTRLARILGVDAPADSSLPELFDAVEQYVDALRDLAPTLEAVRERAGRTERHNDELAAALRAARA